MNLAIDHSREGRLKELDGWRAISVLLVIVHHFGFYHPGLLLRFPLTVVNAVHFCGLLGVRTFFVISGFVICRMLISEEKRNGSVSLKGFYYRRIFRILPPFFLYLAAISLLLTLQLVHENWKSILGAGLFLFDTSLTSHSWFVGHTWSLAAEEQFYLVFPITWILTPKRWRSALCLGVFFLLAGWNLLAFFTHWNMFVGTNGRVGFCCIAWGVLMAVNEHRARQVAKRVPFFLVALVAIGLLVHPVFSETWHRVIYECLMVPPAIALVLLSSLECGPRLRALLCSKPFQAIGLTSYGIYIWQQAFTGPSEYYVGPAVIIPYLLPLLFLIVPLSYFFVEKPAMRYGKYLSRRAQLPQSSPTSEMASPVPEHIAG
jgi:peptidoglycan/LPS O-acetylase OafA/YrhL